MPNWKSCKNLEDFEMFRIIGNQLIIQSTLGQHRDKATIMNISKSPKMPRNAIFFQEFNNFSKFIRETIFSKLEYFGQNQVSGLHPKKSKVIFFQPRLLDPKHSERVRQLFFLNPLMYVEVDQNIGHMFFKRHRKLLQLSLYRPWNYLDSPFFFQIENL